MNFNFSLIIDYVDNQFSLLKFCTGDNSSNCPAASALAYLSIYYLPFVIVFGLTSNVVIIYVFLIAYKKKTRQVIYLGALAVSDIGIIVVMGCFWYVPVKGLPFVTNGRYYFITMNVSNFLCVIQRFLPQFFSCLTSNFFVLINLDRVLSIYFPMKFKTIPLRYSWILVGVVCVISFLLMMPVLFLAGWVITKDRLLLCHAGGALYFRIHDILFSNCGSVASVIIIFLNIALIVKLFKIQSERKDLQNLPNQKKQNSKEISATVVLMLISFTYVSLSLPMVVSNMLAFYPQFIEGNTLVARYYYNILDMGWIVFLTKCSSNWIIYMFRMKDFRQMNMRIFICFRLFGFGKPHKN